jgi:hypothetical protein
VLENFRSLALRLNNEHTNCPKAIQSDNETEFRNASFDQFCLEYGVDQQFLAPRVPQVNGIVEHKNRTLVEMIMTMLDEYMTPRHFSAESIQIACYISNQIFLHLLLNLTPFELRFDCQPSVSSLRPLGCKCFILKHDNLDKFETRCSDGIFLDYTPHGRSYRVLNLETNTVVKSCDVTFNETAPCPHDVFESVGDKEMEASIFVNEELQGFKGDEDEHITPASTSSLGLVPASTLKAEAPQPAPSHIQKTHSSQ